LEALQGEWMPAERRASLAEWLVYWDESGRDGRGVVRVAD